MYPKAMKTLQSNYRKCFQSVIDCKSESRCRIHNENRVAHLLRDYLSNVHREERLIEDRVGSFQKLHQKVYGKEKKNNDSIPSLSNILPPETRTPALAPSVRVKESNMMDTSDTVRAGLSQDPNFGLSNADARKKESRKNNGNVPNGCPEKKKQTTGKANASNQDCLVSAERPYQCPSCEMAFKRKMHLKRHFLVAHSEKKSHVCKICGKLFSRKDYLDKHDAGHLKRNFKLQLLKEGVVVRTKIHTKKNIIS